MANQARLDPLEATEAFPDRQASRQLVVGTVARGHAPDRIVVHSKHLLTGIVDGELTDALPPEITSQWSTRETLLRGKERYAVYCVHCHDVLGSGNGFVPQRGFPEPPTYHSERLRSVPLGHFFQVISDGKGQMAPHRSLVPPEDRWAIAAYIRALQFSQHADVESLPTNLRTQLQSDSNDAERTSDAPSATENPQPENPDRGEEDNS